MNDFDVAITGDIRDYNQCSNPTPPTDWDFVGHNFAPGNYGDLGQNDACIGMQYGYPPSQPPFVADIWWESSLAQGWMLNAVYRNPNTGQEAAWYLKGWYFPGSGVPSRLEITPHVGTGASARPLNPDSAPFTPNPWEFAPGQVPYKPTPAPIKNPIKWPDPVSPEAPDHGPRPNPSPESWPGYGPQPGTSPQPAPEPGTVPNPDPDGAFKDWPASAPTPGATQSSPGTQPRPAQGHQFRPSGPGTKEKKTRLGPVASFVWNTISPITEGIDMINIAYESLPKSMKRDFYQKNGRQPTPQEKMGIIYRNWDDIDPSKFVNDWVMNHWEDKIIGTIGSQLGEASKNDMRPIGYGAGPAL